MARLVWRSKASAFLIDVSSCHINARVPRHTGHLQNRCLVVGREVSKHLIAPLRLQITLPSRDTTPRRSCDQRKAKQPPLASEYLATRSSTYKVSRSQDSPSFVHCTPERSSPRCTTRTFEHLRAPVVRVLQCTVRQPVLRETQVKPGAVPLSHLASKSDIAVL